LHIVLLYGALCVPVWSCGSIPALGEPLETLLRTSEAAPELLKAAKASRDRIQMLISTGALDEARLVEEEAMRSFGFTKVWLKCGPGTFAWTKEVKRSN
jgi:hypothetical protein